MTASVTPGGVSGAPAKTYQTHPVNGEWRLPDTWPIHVCESLGR